MLGILADFFRNWKCLKKTVLAGVEPATFRLTAECSNQLSERTYVRGVGIEPTRIAPLDLKTNSLTTRTSPLVRGCAPRCSLEQLGHPRYGSAEIRTRVTGFKIQCPDRWTTEPNPIVALRAKTVPHCFCPPNCFYSRSNEPSSFCSKTESGATAYLGGRAGRHRRRLHACRRQARSGGRHRRRLHG